MSPHTLLTLYLAASVLTLMMALVQQAISAFQNRKGRALLDLRPAPDTTQGRWIKRTMIAPLAALAVVALWPVGLWLLIVRLYRLCRQTVPGPEDDAGHADIEEPFDTALSDFRPRSDHLVERLTRAAIEQRETVTDPLNAAPPLPFGHLNRRWQAFADQLDPGDELWSFESPHVTAFGTLEVRCGYARMRRGQVLDGMTAERTREA
ncbi:hypothetical protein METUNv1_01570 [Methyloversatilis universalis FAM5]|uniref:Uncharacterized protein n=1 Tax=Methyloversatilis universalis (strain ATCC BAA-1314 / DSM 25237 / JCM 13912 / CCUG 52030 / FAM5) TaxID=1000565 RepID=F5RBC7_METUF|nr:hypothetical protein [Methyloversatilis universalis]EGK72098.1 hypothetical protein METUNv1_01570 [Methyloversatilis universalis FAM5]